MQEISVFWFRRDLRLEDNAALYHALKSGYPVLPIFIFDEDILSDLREKDNLINTDKRIIFIYKQLEKIKNELQKYNSDLLVFHGKVETVWSQLLQQYAVRRVFFNHDYEPYAIHRDTKISNLLSKQNIKYQSFKDHVIFEKNEVLKDDGKPYNVYTPYSKKWKSTLNDFYIKAYPTEKYFHNFLNTNCHTKFLSLNEIGFENTEVNFPTADIDDMLFINYSNTRDIPSIAGTSKLGIHLRFGTISIRKLIKKCLSIQADKFINELIWREFYIHILYHYPNVVTHSFKPEYDKIKWRNNETEFSLWCEGKTGYPIVDAGMRELNATGYMHNRVRMIVASFLCKHLLIDWRWGEAYFAKKLLDYELASNNGSWQWCAGTGVDAAPYFRVFNPSLQTQKFDSNYEYIKKWIPELNSLEYPTPIVEHEVARKRCLERYKIDTEK